MIRIIIYISIFIISTFLSILRAQTTKTIPCSSPEYTQFNFWMGDWNVHDAKEKLVGTNDIKRIPNACRIQENWTTENSPTRYNYYNKTDNTWNQLWIDNTGFSLEPKGAYKDNKMILKSSLIPSKKENDYLQITWIKNTDNSIT